MEEIFEAHIKRIERSYKMGKDDLHFYIEPLNEKTYAVHLDEINYLFLSNNFNDIIKTISNYLFDGDYSDDMDIDDAVQLGQADVDFDSFKMDSSFIRGCEEILADALSAVRDKHKDDGEIFKDANSATISPPASVCEFAFFYQDGSGRFKSNTKRSLAEKKAIYWPGGGPMKVVDSLGLVDYEDESDLQTRSGYLPED
jgi:hypothetical protein